jgi:hypothetical protein
MSLPATDPAARVQALLTLYRESRYDVCLPRGDIATIRIGEVAPESVLRWIGKAGIAFYMTACNPRSHSLPREENEQRLESMRAYVRERGFAFLEGIGHIPGEAWREPNLLIRGISETGVADLVRLHDQNSIVVVRAQAPVTLRVYRSDWHAVSGDSADLEWA